MHIVIVSYTNKITSILFLIHSGIDRKDKKQLEWSRIQYLKCSSQHFDVDQ